MLEGLEISEISLSKAFSITGETRWDSYYYQKHFLINETLIHSFSTVRFSQLCKSIKKGIFDLPPDNYIEEGVPFIRTSNIKNPAINFTSMAYISEEISAENFKTELTPGDLVFTKIGAYIGDVALLPPRYEKYNFSQNVAGAAVLDKKDSAYLLAFFLSREGRTQILRSAMLSGQGKLELEDIRNYEIPEVSDRFKSKLSELLYQKQSLELRASNKYRQAETLLLNMLGLVNFSLGNEHTSIKSFKNSYAITGRLDAEYYQPKYEEFERTVINHPAGFTTIGAEFDLVKKTSQRGKEAYNYIEIGDVDVSDGTASFNRLNVDELPANAKQEVQHGDLLVSKVRPNRGAVAIIDFDDTDLIVSGAFTVLRETVQSIFSNKTLKVLLRTQMYRDWMLKFNIGTQYPVIRDDDILNLPIPRIDDHTQTKVADLVQQSFALKASSEQLLMVAKRTVELAIEEDELGALRYLDQHRGDQ